MAGLVRCAVDLFPDRVAVRAEPYPVPMAKVVGCLGCVAWGAESLAIVVFVLTAVDQG